MQLSDELDRPSVSLGRIKHALKTGSESFHVDGRTLSFTLLDFWRWISSDLVSNTTRGLLAEFVVATALETPVGVVREEWAPWDLTTPEGIKVEVKSAAYLQSWFQKRLSKIEFSIRPSRAWNADTAVYADTTERQADVYVFALLTGVEKPNLDPLNISQWEFWVLPTAVLNEQLPTQESIAVPLLNRLAGDRVRYTELRQAVVAAAKARAV